MHANKLLFVPLLFICLLFQRSQPRTHKSRGKIIFLTLQWHNLNPFTITLSLALGLREGASMIDNKGENISSALQEPWSKGEGKEHHPI